MNAVDTNILLYSIDRNEPTKQLVAQQLLQQLHAAPPTHIFALAGARRADPATAPLARPKPVDTGRVLRPPPRLPPPVSPGPTHRRNVRFRTELGRPLQSVPLGQHDPRSLPNHGHHTPLHRRHGRPANDRWHRIDQSVRMNDLGDFYRETSGFLRSFSFFAIRSDIGRQSL